MELHIFLSSTLVLHLSSEKWSRKKIKWNHGLIDSYSYFIVKQSSNFCLSHFSNKVMSSYKSHLWLQRTLRLKVCRCFNNTQKRVFLCTPCVHPLSIFLWVPTKENERELQRPLYTTENNTVGQLDIVDQIWRLILHNDCISWPSWIGSQVKQWAVINLKSLIEEINQLSWWVCEANAWSVDSSTEQSWLCSDNGQVLQNVSFTNLLQ